MNGPIRTLLPTPGYGVAIGTEPVAVCTGEARPDGTAEQVARQIGR